MIEKVVHLSCTRSSRARPVAPAVQREVPVENPVPQHAERRIAEIPDRPIRLGRRNAFKLKCI